MKKQRVAKREHSDRVKTSLIMTAVFFSIMGLDLWLRWPLFPIAVSFVALCCLAEAVTVTSHKRLSFSALCATILQFAILLVATGMVWAYERIFSDWLLYLMAVIITVPLQNIFAFYIGRFWLPTLKNTANWFVKFLSWRHFKYSSKKTFGITIFSSFLALIVSLAVFIWTDNYVVMGIVVLSAILAAAGDWVGSWFKRQVRVKDSGEKLRRGSSIFAKMEDGLSSHGGFLDRFNALFFCVAVILPVVLLYLLKVVSC